MLTKPSRILVCVAAAALFATTGLPVQAGNWGSSFDPIGMNGTDLISIVGSDCTNPDGLTDPVNFFFVNGYGENNCSATLLNASVTLTDLPATDTAQLTFGPSGAIWGIDIAPDGTLLGVDSFQIGPESVSEGVFSGPWWIQLSAQDGETLIDPPPFSPINVVYLFTGSCDECINDFPTYTATVTKNLFLPVPEPGSLGLLLAALGAGWLTKRRKAAA